jgi:hydrogenase small subunit
MPFMDAPPGSSISSMLVKPYGAVIRRLRGITNTTVNTEPRWRHNRDVLTSGYNPRWRPLATTSSQPNGRGGQS